LNVIELVKKRRFSKTAERRKQRLNRMNETRSNETRKFSNGSNRKGFGTATITVNLTIDDNRIEFSLVHHWQTLKDS